MNKTWIDHRLKEISFLVLGKIGKTELTFLDMEKVRRFMSEAISHRLTMFINWGDERKEGSNNQ